MSHRNLADRLETIAAAQEPTSKARAAEIAGMNVFGVLEFVELTGIELGPYGIYRVDNDGVQIGLLADESTFTGRQRIDLRDACEKLCKLDFPCSPEDFYNWYETTLGENRVSDFPLATGFLDALGKKLPPRATSGVSPVPSTKIMEAFDVRPETAQNRDWWNARMRSAKRYGLTNARASQGGRGRGKPSYWQPLVIAVWLIEKKHLTKGTVIQAVMR
jgi:hypothetical protein